MPSQTHYLGNYDGNRQNNFTAIRLVLAWMVIFAHSFDLQPAEGVTNPLSGILRESTTTGQMAVDGFFVISGFLVTGSFLSRGLRDYALSRVFRVIPGLAVCVCLTVFLLGPIATNLPVAEYFLNPTTFDYLKNALAVADTEYVLPGVFADNAYTSVNGSLWSIPYEMKCYIALAALGTLGVLKSRGWSSAIATLTLLVFWSAYVNPEFLGLLPHVASALLCFPLGVLLYLNRRLVILDTRVAVLAMTLLYFSFGETWFRYVYPFAWAYLLFFLAYRTRFINLDKSIGDISYGIYIYAFPVQQSVVWLVPAGNAFTNLIVSTIVVLPLAYLSWRIIEKPSMTWRSRLTGS